VGDKNSELRGKAASLTSETKGVSFLWCKK
jgi:hypothetical protein